MASGFGGDFGVDLGGDFGEDFGSGFGSSLGGDWLSAGETRIARIIASAGVRDVVKVGANAGARVGNENRFKGFIVEL